MPKKKKLDDFAKKWVICKNNIPSEIYSSLAGQVHPKILPQDSWFHNSICISGEYLYLAQCTLLSVPELEIPQLSGH